MSALDVVMQASRIRREATDAQVAQYAALTAELPKLLVTGSCDQLVPPSAVAEVGDRLGGSHRDVELPGCGHLSHEEAAPQLQDQLVDFISHCLWS